jgi:hypothetical protein
MSRALDVLARAILTAMALLFAVALTAVIVAVPVIGLALAGIGVFLWAVDREVSRW